MVEPLLYASLGALLATLIGLLFLPFFWGRAVRLTTKRLIDRLPVSASEIIASQDRLRAEQAMSMRIVERKAELAIGEATRDRIESARARSTELGHLADISDLRAQVAGLETEGARVRGELDKTGREAAAAHEALEAARAAVAAVQADLQTARQETSAARSELERERLKSSTREAEIAALRARLAVGVGAPSIEGPAESAPDPSDAAPITPKVGVSPPKLPKADFSVAFPAPAEAKPQPAATVAEAAELADLRRRLDEVADALAEAASREVQPAQPRPEPTTERPRLPQVERAEA